MNWNGLELPDNPYYQDDAVYIVHADCRDILPLIPDKSIDLVLTDPPYNLGFMGKKWDKGGIAFNSELWGECLRVIKPGSNFLAFGGTRTYHRMVCAIEDAGFEIRDCIMWVYGSGFPKSLNIGKAVDKLRGSEREVVGESLYNSRRPNPPKSKLYQQGGWKETVTKGTSEWEGYGTGLKPAYEPIVLAMKPLDGTFAENCLKWRVGGLNIDQCRIGIAEADRVKMTNRSGSSQTAIFGNQQHNGWQPKQGRFPANFIHDGSQEVMELFPNSSITGKRRNPMKGYHQPEGGEWFGRHNHDGNEYTDTGSAARFFYCAKASKKERDMGCEDLPNIDPHTTYAGDEWSREHMGNTPTNKREMVKNNHPTVKPLALMEYLVKLVTRPQHIVLDPFVGSGTTAYCAKKLGRKCIGIEIEEKYCEIAAKRLSQSVMRLEIQ